MNDVKQFFDDLEDWKKVWKNMPEFVQHDFMPKHSIKVHFNDSADLKEFAELLGQNITPNTQFIYYPKLQKENLKAKRIDGSGNPKYPVFVPTKGRSTKRYTIDCFERLGIPYRAVIEKQEYKRYKRHIHPSKLLVVPHQNEGLTVTRNWIWDFAQSEGHEFFWTFDDNIQDFYRLNRNIKYRMKSGIFLEIIENFVERYENIAIAGMQYEMFVPRKRRCAPYLLNTRVYSNMLIRTDIPYRNELFYNDDTDLCLRVMKDGWCTFLFQSFLADKIASMAVKGGMTDYYEKTNKRYEFAEMLQKAHPDVVKIVQKFNRWHHQVDYTPFKRNKLKLKQGIVPPNEVNDFGMTEINEIT